MMTAKHFRTIAAAIREQRSVTPDTDRETLAQTAKRLAEAFRADNPRFDRERFLIACGFSGV